MNIIIVGYYELKESLLSAAKSLEKQGFNIDCYPLYQKYLDIHTKIDNYVEDMIQFINNKKPDYLLWWYYGIPYEEMEKIINGIGNIKNIMYNWDDPHNFYSNKLDKKVKFFDYVFVCSNEKLQDYINYGAKEAYLLYPGYDENVHKFLFDYPKHDIIGECDISICCTNLYDGKDYENQLSNRKKIIDEIYKGQEENGYTFFIYGPNHLRNIYPKSYRGYVSYEDTNLVFNMSKINLNTHVEKADGYLNERNFLVFASGGLLLVDKNENTDLLQDGINCIIIKENIIDQITEILKNYGKYYKIRNNALNYIIKYSWENWAKRISEVIQR